MATLFFINQKKTMNTKTITSKLDKLKLAITDELQAERIEVTLSNIEMEMDEFTSMFDSIALDFAPDENTQHLMSLIPVMKEKITMILGGINDIEEELSNQIIR